jgi:hypothetical protein
MVRHKEHATLSDTQYFETQSNAERRETNQVSKPISLRVLGYSAFQMSAQVQPALHLARGRRRGPVQQRGQRSGTRAAPAWRRDPK